MVFERSKVEAVDATVQAHEAQMRGDLRECCCVYEVVVPAAEIVRRLVGAEGQCRHQRCAGDYPQQQRQRRVGEAVGAKLQTPQRGVADQSLEHGSGAGVAQQVHAKEQGLQRGQQAHDLRRACAVGDVVHRQVEVLQRARATVRGQAVAEGAQARVAQARVEEVEQLEARVQRRQSAEVARPRLHGVHLQPQGLRARGEQERLCDRGRELRVDGVARQVPRLDLWVGAQQPLQRRQAQGELLDGAVAEDDVVAQQEVPHGARPLHRAAQLLEARPYRLLAEVHAAVREQGAPLEAPRVADPARRGQAPQLLQEGVKARRAGDGHGQRLREGDRLPRQGAGLRRGAPQVLARRLPARLVRPAQPVQEAVEPLVGGAALGLGEEALC
mmetsp:Transcript_17276/g.45714  ORF Transcript_17276/g.45714 Transcript_17276/m.45714 type:complete len:386 (+) Transcript_17276:337-1494(+)